MQVENPFKGPSSYEDGDKFYGRETEIKELSSLIKNELLTLLFSRSGTGKSSLIKAGLFPYLKIDFEFFPVHIHLNDAAVMASSAYTLCDFVIKRCEEEIKKQFSNKENFKINLSVNRNSDSLFEFIHNTEIIETDSDSSTEYKIKPVLFFDQLEEIFTNPFQKKELQFLIREIRCLVENEVPDYLKEEIISENEQYNKIKNALKNKQKNFRVFFSFREEYLPQFESLRKEIPSIRFTNSRYRLEPFTISTATDIIVKTAPIIPPAVALVIAENISTTVEGFDEKRVDPFLMSLICQIIYSDISGDINATGTVENERIRALVENALESYVSKVYNGISEATKMFIEYRLITSDGKKNSVNFNEVETNAVLCTEILTLVNNPDTRLLSIGQFLDSKHITILHDRLLPPLVKRKVERKAMEEKDALAAKEAALEKDNKKKQRRLILSFIAGALLLSFWLFANIRQQNTIAILKVVADSAAYRAKEDSISVVKMNDSVAGMIKKNASLLDETVFEGRNAAIAIKKLESASKLNQDLKRANKEIIAYTDELASQKKELQGRVDYNDVEKDLRESTITIESFGNRDLFEEVFKSLLGLKKTKQTDQYNKLLFSIEDAIEINKTYGYDANTFYSYSNAKTLWQQNKEFPVIEKILLKNFINTSLFYKQILSLPKSDTSGDKKGKTFLSFNNSGMGRNDIKFSINNGNRVYTGNYMSNKDSIQINKVSNLIPAKTEKLNSLIYANDEIIGLQDNLLFGYSINQKMSPVKNKINVASYTQGTLSPDGNYLVTYSDYDSAILWKLDGLKIKEPIGLTLSPGNYKSILFSGDGNWLLTLSTNDDLRLFNMDSIKLKNSAEAVLKYKGIRAVNFSPESGNLIMMVQNAVFFQDLTHYTKENTFGLAKKILDLPYTVIDYIDPVNSISISADFKKIMIEKIKDLFVIRILNENNKLLSNKNIPVDSVIIRQFKNQAIICNAAFLNTDNILAIDEMGKIFVCEIYPEFKSIANAFNSIKTPPLPLLEQIKMNATNAVFNEIINSGDAVLIENAANTYREKFYDGENSLVQKSDSLDLFHSDTLFKKAIQLYSKNQDANFEPLIKIYSTLRDREISNKGKAPYSLEIVKLEEKYNLKSSKELSLEYSDLSFYTFFQKDFKNALEYIFTAKKLDSTNGIIYTNLALAYLFNNQFANAEKIYMAKMDSSYITNGIPSKYNESFLQDFEDLETAGIINSKEYLLYEEVKKIKSTILTKGKK